MKVNEIDIHKSKLYNLKEELNILKKNILECQKNKLGPLTSKTLKRYRFKNKHLLEKMNVVENHYNEIKKMKNIYLKENKNLHNKHLEKERILTNNYINRINKINENFSKEYIILRKKLEKVQKMAIEKTRLDVKFGNDINKLNNDIKIINEMIVNIKDDIYNLNNETEKKKKRCNNKKEEIRDIYVNRSSKYCCEKETVGGTKVKKDIGIKKIGLRENLKKLDNQLNNAKTDLDFLKYKINFLNEYIFYLKKLHKLCKEYKVNPNIPVRCIIYTDNQVQNRIEEMEKEIKDYSKMSLSISKIELEEQHKNRIADIRSKYDKEINLKMKYERLELNNINNKINDLDINSQKLENIKFKYNREVNALTNKKKLLLLKYERLEKIYGVRNRTKLNYKKKCLKKLNNFQLDEMEKLEKLRNCPKCKNKVQK